MTLKDWLARASQHLMASSQSPQLDAELLACHVLKKERTYLYSYPEYELSDTAVNTLNERLHQRLTGKPIAYIIGEQEFWSLPLYVNQHTLIPRPDTECLVESALNHLSHMPSPTVIDLGTGSGAIAIAIAHSLPNAQVFGIDCSLKALEIAKKNTRRHLCHNVHLIQTSWFDGLNIKADLIVTNPPYIANNDPFLEKDVFNFEPTSALIAQDNGLSDIKSIAQKAPHFLKPEGMLLCEHGHQQQSAVFSIFAAYGFSHIIQHQDLAKNPRAISGLKVA